MTKINRAMRPLPGVPSEWVCNASQRHKSPEELPEPMNDLAIVQCHCVECSMSRDGRLVTGPPQPTEERTAEQLAAEGLVGLYTRKPEFYIPCHECHVNVPVTDAGHVASVRSGESVLYHHKCYPEVLEDVVTPYVLRKEGLDAAEKGSGCICGEDGGAAEEERLQGDLGGEEPRSSDGEAVG